MFDLFSIETQVGIKLNFRIVVVWLSHIIFPPIAFCVFSSVITRAKGVGFLGLSSVILYNLGVFVHMAPSKNCKKNLHHNS